jgi:uncharacterized protein YodC (DUF2158 family)
MATEFNPIFAAGDVVRLNSGSPDLTVIHTWPTMDPATALSDPKTVNYVRVAWVDAYGEPQDADLPEVCFTKVVSEELTDIFSAIFSNGFGEPIALNPPENFEDDDQSGIGIGGGN